MLASKGPSTNQVAAIEENLKIEIINENQDDSPQTDQVLICYNEPFTDYI